ncbi:MAG: MlaD family protein [Pseudomonadota bacterium]
METRANSLIVGLFALVAIVAAGLFTWWQSSGTGGVTREVLFVFPGSVAGLTAGSPVLFNGIKVGDVTGLSLDPQDLRVVNVTARVSETAPLKTDTRAILEFQGLTGYASIGLSGGSFTADSLFAVEGRPRLEGQQSTLTQLLADGNAIAQRATSILDQADTLLQATAPDITATVANASVISGNLATASEDVATVLGAAGDVATSFQALSGQVGTLANQVGETVGQIDIAEINTALSNVASVTGTLASNEEEIGRLLVNAETASTQLTELLTQAGSFASEARQAVSSTRTVISTVESLAAAVEPGRVSSILANVDAATGLVQANGDEISRIARNAGEASERINTILGDASGVGARIDAVTSAIDPEALGDAVFNVRSLTETLAQSGEDVASTVTSARTAVERVSSALEGTEGLGARVGTIVEGIDPVALGETVASVRDATASAERAAAAAETAIAGIDPEALGDTVFNVRSLSETLAGSAESVSRTIGSVETAAGRAASALEGTETLGTQVEAIVAGIDPVALGETVASVRDATAGAERALAAIDPEALGDTVFNVRSLTETLAGSAEDVSRTIASAETAVSRAASALEGTETLGTQVEAIVAGIDPVALGETVASVRDATASAERTAASAEAAIAGIDAEALGDAVFNVRSLTETLAGSADAVSRTIGSAELAASRVATALEGTEGLGAQVNAIAETASSAATRVDGVLEGIAPEAVGRVLDTVGAASESANALLTEAQGLPSSIDQTLSTTRGAIREARGVIEAVEPDSVRSAIADVNTLTASLAAQTPDIEATVDNLRTASEQVNAVLGDASDFSQSFGEVSTSAQTLVERLDTILADVEPDAVAATVSNLRDFTGTLSENRDAVGQTLQDVSGLAARLRESADRVDGLITSAQGLVDDEAEALLLNASAAAQSLRDLSSDLGTRVPQIAENLNSFTGRGLEGLTDLIQEGKRTVGTLDRVIGSVENNPEQFLFGRSGGSDYQPRGRQ